MIIEIKEIFRILTIPRIINLLKFKSKQVLLRIGISTFNNVKPHTITLELSSICNLRCPECLVGMGHIKRSQPFMSLGVAKKIIDSHYKHAVVAILYFQGEPMLNPHWNAIVQYASEKSLYTLISTNGHFLTDINCNKLIKSGLNRLIVSVDGITQEEYAAYRKNGNLKTVFQGLKTLARTKTEEKTKRPFVIFQTLVNKNNESSLKKLKSISSKYGASKFVAKTMQIYNQTEENIEKWTPTNKQYSRYNKKRTAKKIICPRALGNAVYTTNGILVPCCFDKLGSFAFGSIDNNAWRSGKRGKFIQTLSKGKSIPFICNNCTENL